MFIKHLFPNKLSLSSCLNMFVTCANSANYKHSYNSYQC